MNEQKFTVNDRIRLSARVLNKTQKEISEATGIPAWRVSDICVGRGRVTATELSKISSTLGTTPDCLIGNSALFDVMLEGYGYSLWSK